MHTSAAGVEGGEVVVVVVLVVMSVEAGSARPDGESEGDVSSLARKDVYG